MAAEHSAVKSYGYRWVVLAVWMFVNILMQALWICYSPVSSQAAQVWGVSEFWVGFLAMSFMYVYVVMSLPASWVIEKYGFSFAVAVSGVVMGAAALIKGIFPLNYTVVLSCQIAMAIVQPLMVNSGTKLAARWFPIQERATVVGIGSLGPFIGQAFGLMATPFMVNAYGFAKHVGNNQAYLAGFRQCIGNGRGILERVRIVDQRESLGTGYYVEIGRAHV